MVPRRPMPDEDRAIRGENPTLGREDDADLDETPIPTEEERPATPDERRSGSGRVPPDRAAVTPDDESSSEEVAARPPRPSR